MGSGCRSMNTRYFCPRSGAPGAFETPRLPISELARSGAKGAIKILLLRCWAPGDSPEVRQDLHREKATPLPQETRQRVTLRERHFPCQANKGGSQLPHFDNEATADNQALFPHCQSGPERRAFARFEIGSIHIGYRGTGVVGSACTRVDVSWGIPQTARTRSAFLW